MKTSDEILIGLIVLVFTVPLLLAYTLKNKMEKGEYTVEKYKTFKNNEYKSGTFTAFKVVKVIGPGPEYLRCIFTLSNEMNYSYHSGSKLKIEVLNSSDTLVVKYNPAKDQALDGQIINVSLPSFNNLIVDGASVILDSIAIEGTLNLTLKNNGVVRDGTKRAGKAQSFSEAPHSKKETVVKPAVVVKVDVAKARIASLKTEASPDIREMLIYRLLYRI